MSIISKIFGKPEKKEVVASANTPDEIARIMLAGGGESASGEMVSPSTAMRCAAVFACVGVLSESVAQLPIKVFREVDGGKEVAKDHPLYTLLHARPNAWMDSFEYRELAMTHLALRGNHYAFKVAVDGGRTVKELLPIPPECVTVKQEDDYSITYRVNFGSNRGTEIVTPDRMFHVRFRSLDGIAGISPIGYARESIGLAIATEKHGARLFKNGARPGGLLKHPRTMSEDAAKRFMKSWHEAFSGASLHKTALLEEGMEFQTLSMTSEDAQFLETRRFQTEDIARIYRVPLHMIQETTKTTSWGSGLEEMTLGFLKFTLLPWLRRWESAIQRQLVAPQDQGEYFAEFVVDGMERGDIKSRYEAYQLAITNGIMSPNEIRARENLNRRDGGDDFFTPLNMTTGRANDGDNDGN